MSNIPGIQPIGKYGKVLIVDDDPELLDVVRQVLESHKLIVSAAENGQQALEIVAQEKFDVILSDIKMPEMDGIQFLEALGSKSIPTPVVFYSGFFEKEMLQRAMQLGAFDFLGKPIGSKKMLQVIDNATEVGVLQRKVEFIRENKKEKLYDFIPEYENRITQLCLLNYLTESNKEVS